MVRCARASRASTFKLKVMASKFQFDFQWQYDQQEKKECRSRLLEHAVRCLTTERDTSVCVQRYHVSNVWKKLQETNVAKQYFSFQERQQIASEIENWQHLHESRVGTKKPSDLCVCYLGGDNPVNDLEVLIENRVLTQNVWAIEKDAASFKNAQECIKCYPHLTNVKLFKGDFLTFLKDVEGQFDIIYYDACGTLPSARQNTLKFIGYVFLYNKLTSPGALITNFSFPPEQPVQVHVNGAANSSPEDDEKDRIRFLSGEYLKCRLSNTSVVQYKDENAIEDIYGDYITYQVIDSAYLYIPAYRMLSSTRSGRSCPLWDQLFVRKEDFLKEVKLYDISSSTDSFLQKIGSTMKESTNCLCKAWVTEIFPDLKPPGLKDLESMLLTHLLTCSENCIRKFANEDFQEHCLEPIFKDLDKHGGRIARFCDVPDPSSATCLVGGLLYGQLAHPSFPVVEKLLRLKYTAKKRQMFSDVFIFDKCRYIYDQFPSVHFAYSALIEPRQQMVLRMALDGMKKPLRTIYKGFWNVAGFHVNNSYIPQRQKIESSLLSKAEDLINNKL